MGERVWTQVVFDFGRSPLHLASPPASHHLFSSGKMQVNPEHLQQLAQLLNDTVSPDTTTRKTAESNLNSAAQQQGFLLLLLETVRSDQASKVVRQAAGVYFKNVVKRQWEEPEEVSRLQFQPDQVPD